MKKSQLIDALNNPDFEGDPDVWLQDDAADEGTNLRPVCAVKVLGDIILPIGPNEGDVVIQFGQPQSKQFAQPS